MNYAVEPKFTNEFRIAWKTFTARILKQPAINRLLQSLLHRLRDASEMKAMIKRLLFICLSLIHI